MSHIAHDSSASPPKPEVSVTLKRDGLEAWIAVTPPTPVPLAELEERIQQCGVSRGLDRDLLRRIAGDPPETPVLIAKGRLPQSGAPARIDYVFQAPPSVGIEAVTELARVDFHDGHVTQVLQGQVLARKTPATAGTPGYTVTGQVLPATLGADANFDIGKNVTLSQDKLEALAGISGLPMFEGGKLTIVPAFTVGNVDFSTGSIVFQGSVIIKGNVMAGFSVVATENIEVDGFVEGGTLRAVGSIHVKGGVRQHAVLEADRIHARYVDTASTLKALGDIQIDKDAVQSTLSAGGKISVGQRLVGGHASAGSQIEAGQIGHPSEPPTHVEIVLFKASKQSEELNAEISNLQSVLALVEERLQLEQTTPSAALGKLLQQRIALGLAIKQLELHQQEPCSMPHIMVKGEIYPGVLLSIHHTTQPIMSKLTGKTFKWTEEGITH